MERKQELGKGKWEKEMAKEIDNTKLDVNLPKENQIDQFIRNDRKEKQENVNRKRKADKE